ncbi:MAG: hypothetical protein HDQ88_02965 [Clostridia bacterium]|nr:hypothetical protein [Clostridia bacterium]
MDDKTMRKDTAMTVFLSILLALLFAGVAYLLFSGVTLFFGFNWGLISDDKLLAFQTGTVDGFMAWLTPDPYRLIVTGATFVLSLVILLLCFKRCTKN